IFGIVWLTQNGFVKRSSRRVEIIGAKRKQAEIEGIVVFVGIKVDGVLEVGLCVLRFALTRESEAEIVENLGKIGTRNRSGGAGGLIAMNRFLQGDEDLLRLVGLIEPQAANADGEIGF